MASIDGGNLVGVAQQNANPAYSNLTPEELQAFQGLGTPWSAGNYQAFNSEVGQNVNDFKSQFTNLVGRAPTDAELNTFHQQFIAPNVGNLTNPNDPKRQNTSSYIQQFLGQNFQKTAQDYATEQLKGQQDQANSLAGLFRQQGNDAISSTENSLLDYQSKLFDRLRPNLLTSLKSQGLLDTGGMNEAMAGVQGDLANNASNYIAGLHLQNEQGANQIAFGGAAAPYQYQQQNIMGQPGQLASAAGNAQNFNNGTFMSNLAYQQNLGLLGAQGRNQQNMQPSFMKTMGQSFANKFGESLGNFSGQAAQGLAMKAVG